MAVNLRHLKYFIATAELGRVKAASMALSISQSAVTLAIQELERTVDGPLFTRTSAGMELTPRGREFLAAAYDITSKVEDALTAAGRDSALEGRLVVAATYTVIGYFLPYHLQRIQQAYPRLKIEIHEVNRELAEEGLINRRYDIGVLLTSNLASADLASERLVRSQRRLWAPSRHPFLKRDRVTFADIAAEDYIMLTVDEAAHTALKYWSRLALQPKVRLRTSSVEAVRSIVANGGGVAILSDMVYRPWSLEGRRIETIIPVEDAPPMDVGLAWLRGGPMSPEMTAFRNYFRNVFLAPQSHLDGVAG